MVKNLILITIILYTLLCTSGCQSIIRSNQSYLSLKKGKVYADKRQYEKAESFLIKAINHDQENAEAWVALGDIYFTIENYEGSRHAYEEALRYDRDAFSAYAGLWRLRLVESGYTEEAKAEVKEEIEDFISSADKRPERLLAAYFGLRYLHEYDYAFSVAKEIIASAPSDEITSLLATYTFEETLGEKDNEKRLLLIEEFKRLFPHSKEIYMANALRLKIAARDLNDKEILYRYGEEWIQEAADNRKANFTVGYYYTEADVAIEKAVSYIRRALRLIKDPDPADKPEHYPDSDWHKDLERTKGAYYDTLGWAYFNLGRYKEAENAYRTATKYLDSNQNLYYHIGLLLEEKGDIDGAIHSYAEALKSGENKDAAERLGTLTAAQHGYDDEPLHRFFAWKEGITTFTEVTEEAGLSGVKGIRAAWGDYNNDGNEDILLNGALLFRNNGDGTFTDVTDDAGIDRASGGNGGIWGDFDNDGHVDFYTFTSRKGTYDRFWRNNGDGTFTDITMSSIESPDSYPTEAAAWGDYDRDGFIDLYIANYEKPLFETVERAMCTPDRLFHNNGNGAFTDASYETGTVSLEHMCGRGVNWGDYDNDGNLDIYVANYRLDPNLLWRNNGDGTFTNVALDAGVEGSEEGGYYGHSIGAEWGDYDNDGDLDLFVSNLAHPRYIGISDKSMLLENQGQSPLPKFINIFPNSSIRFEETSADPSLADYDNDGILDLYFTSTYSGRKSFLYKGKGDGTFTDVTWLAGVRVDNGWGNAFADYDNDGDLDLLAGSSNGVRLFRNDGNNNHWLHVRVTGRESNRAGIGARVRVKAPDTIPTPSLPLSLPSPLRGEGQGEGKGEGKKGGGNFPHLQIREIQGGKGSGSQHSLPVEFGLGDYSGPVDVEVRFPSGKVARLTDVKTDQKILVEE